MPNEGTFNFSCTYMRQRRFEIGIYSFQGDQTQCATQVLSENAMDRRCYPMLHSTAWKFPLNYNSVEGGWCVYARM
jgi:hypothetical protein